MDLTHEDISKGFTQWLVFITRSRKLLTHFLHHFTVVTWKVVTQRRVGGRRKERREERWGDESWQRESEAEEREMETGEREERLAGRETGEKGTKSIPVQPVDSFIRLREMKSDHTHVS